MVHDKAKSGDPDFDDKVPADQHAQRIVSAPDGRDVAITDSAGPVDRVTGQHVSLDAPADDGDNRPAPGSVATEASEVQTYDADDTPQATTVKGDADAGQQDSPLAQSGDEQSTKTEAGPIKSTSARNRASK
jgi:hypothetical protein